MHFSFTEHLSADRRGRRRRHATALPVASHKQLKGEKGDEEAEPVTPDNNAAFIPCNIHNHF